jgi:hypothetical protein
MEQTIPIYCYLEQTPITLHIGKHQTTKEIAVECLKQRERGDTRKIPRIYNSQGSIIPIGPNIPPNTETRRYRLQFCESQVIKTPRQDEMEKLQGDIDIISTNIDVI